MSEKISSFRDLRVYQKLKSLHLEVHGESLRFPKFEMYELGSQVRRSSNSAPAILAEGWGSRHTNMYIEAINRSMGEVRETQHHIDIAHEKGYLDARRFGELDDGYDHCGRMLERLHQRLSNWRNSVRRPTDSDYVSEEEAEYRTASSDPEWDAFAQLTLQADAEFEQ